ncbi:MAG: hypothetical protein Q8Q73_01955 [Stagnimonas sp.]|nr:hypothetical protein [Stagnimonas sp.]
MRARARALLVAALLCAACSRPVPPPVEPAATTPAPAAEPAAYRYADELAASRQRVAEARAAIARGPVVWPQWATLAAAQLALARLRGDYADYLEVEQSLAQAFAISGRGGPYLERARYHFSVHRLDRVDADLALAERENNPDPAAILGLRADLDFYRGRYPEALAGYRAALARREDLGGLVRLALWHARMGHHSEALALFDRADAIYHGDSPYPRAWLALQRGLLALERGRWDDAMAHYQHALRLLPDWWLAREHIAEIYALRGEAAPARREYEAVIAETGNPEYMDAMAKLAEHEGRHDEARQWIAKARAGYDQRLAQLPEASYGHGLDHFLQFGPPDLALRLARANHAQRPNGEAQIKLADALLHNGQAAEAVQLMRRALASEWDTPELHAAAARSFAAAGLGAEARAQAALAKAGNPHAAQQFGLPDLPIAKPAPGQGG